MKTALTHPSPTWTLSFLIKRSQSWCKCAFLFYYYFDLFEVVPRSHDLLICWCLLRDDTHVTSIKIVKFSRPPHPIVQLRPEFFHALDLGRPISNDPPTLSPNDNQSIQRKHNPRMTIIHCQVFLSLLLVGFCFQYQPINLTWFCIDFFPFSHLAEANLVPRAILNN